MENDAYKILSKEYSPLFGQIAVYLGFVTEKQLKEALVEQVDDDLSNKPHRFIGKILSEHGWITYEQIKIVLAALEIYSKASLVYEINKIYPI